MDEFAGLFLAFGLGGGVIGALLGWIGNQRLFWAGLALGIGAVVLQAVWAFMDHGWGQLGYMLFAGLTLWGTIVAAVVCAIVQGIRANVTSKGAVADKDIAP
jgi:hypothetical protein